MFEILVIAVVGTALAGLWDLKTTEVPDPLAFGLVGVGILYWIVNATTTGVYTSLIISLSVGSLLLALGLIMYKKGQWGGADAWILAAIGYMVPIYNGRLFIADYIANFAVVALLYTIAYALIIGLLNPKLFGIFTKDVREKYKLLVIPFAALFGSVVGYIFTASYLVLPLVVAFAFASLMALFFVYAKTVEHNYFTRKIHVDKLRKGDVLQKSKWVGLTEAQVRKLKSRKDYVTIKDGVRFVPVFSIALVVTLLWGSVFLIIFG